jgi:asparagine synthase (glutamine-hydrolysing)
MCGIWAYVKSSTIQNSEVSNEHEINKKIQAANTLECRGPDKTIHLSTNDYTFIFHRLAIHDLSSNGDQPFSFEFTNKFGEVTKIDLMCNGEIYNYKDLISDYQLQDKLKSTSDCEVIGLLLYEFNFNIRKTLLKLRGEFAFVARAIVTNKENEIKENMLLIGRDPYGVRPLYYGISKDAIILSSLMSGITLLDDPNIKCYHFPPGYSFQGSINEIPYDEERFKRYFSDEYNTYRWKSTPMKSIQDKDTYDIMVYYEGITQRFIDAVRERLDSEREVGFLLSGGLDSSLVVAVATKICNVQKPQTFNIGFEENAPDVQCAYRVAEYLDTNHHAIIVDTNDAINTIPEVIKSLETYDITTIRASTPQFLLAQYIKETTDIRVILNGDGSDEVSMGYLYNYYAPSDEEAHADSIRLLTEIHMYDGLRVDRTLAAHGLEARLPFLDRTYVASYLELPIELRRPSVEKNRMEKQFLRDAFNVLYPGLLPLDILYRKKEAFSDGVSQMKKSWYTVLQEQAKWENKTEQQWYKEIFDNLFPGQDHIIPKYWMPQWTAATDPSARTLEVYENQTEKLK